MVYEREMNYSFCTWTLEEQNNFVELQQPPSMKEAATMQGMSQFKCTLAPLQEAAGIEVISSMPKACSCIWDLKGKL